MFSYRHKFVWLIIFFVSVTAGFYFVTRFFPFTTNPDQNIEQSCASKSLENCGGQCQLCPPCQACSSLGCHSKQFCATIPMVPPQVTLPTKSTSCGIENCHGLEIKCGSNVPQSCTLMYQIGDRCLQYASCQVQNGQCQPVQNLKFENCKQCVQRCSTQYENDPIKLSQCESQCE